MACACAGVPPIRLTKDHDLPRECDIEVKGFTVEGDMVDRGTLATKAPGTPVYVRGDRVKLVPLRKHSQRVDIAADKKEEEGNRGTDVTLSSKQEDSGAATSDAFHMNVPDEPGSTSDTDAMPDADAKLERLPSNTPVLRPWGEATGVERRWRSPADETFEMERMALAGASYMSNAATVEVGDSDAESKDGSTNSAVSSGGERRTWTRNSTLSDVIASGLPLLSAMSSDCSDVNRGSTTGQPVLHGASSSRVGDSTPRVAPVGGLVLSGGGDGGEFGELTEMGIDRGGEGGGNLSVDDVRSERASTNSSRPRACAGAKDGTDELLRGEQGGAEEESKAPSSPKSSSKWMVRVRAAAMPRKARLQLYLERQKSLTSPGPSLEKAREWMMAWTPEMDVSLLHLLGTNGTKAVSCTTCMKTRDMCSRASETVKSQVQTLRTRKSGEPVVRS